MPTPSDNKPQETPETEPGYDLTEEGEDADVSPASDSNDGQDTSRSPDDASRDAPPPEEPESPALESPETESPQPERGDHPWEPIPLVGEGVTECPSCGAPMPGEDEVVCLRCGFDLTQNRQINTETGVKEVHPDDIEPPEGEEEQEKPVITPPGMGDLQAPAIAAGVAFLILTIFFLIGWHGLFKDAFYQNGDGDKVRDIPEFSARIAQLMRFYIVTLVIAASVWAGLHFSARLERRNVGDNALAAMRCLAIVAVCQLVLLLPQPFGWWGPEVILELALRAGALLGLLLMIFNLVLREALVVGAAALLIGTIITLIVNLASWAL